MTSSHRAGRSPPRRADHRPQGFMPVATYSRVDTTGWDAVTTRGQGTRPSDPLHEPPGSTSSDRRWLR